MHVLYGFESISIMNNDTVGRPILFFKPHMMRLQYLSMTILLKLPNLILRVSKVIALTWINLQALDAWSFPFMDKSIVMA